MMLERKGIDYKRIDLMPVVSKGVLRRCGFPGITVPALKIDGRKDPGSREIARELDRVQPDPPLFPADPDARAAVEEAERWGDETLQTRSRGGCSGTRCSATARRSRATREGARLGRPDRPRREDRGADRRALGTLNEATDENVRADLAALPGMLQRIDDWIADGVLGGEELNAADLQIGDQHPPADDPGRPARADRRPPGRGSWRCASSPSTRATPRRSCRRAWLAPLRERPAAASVSATPSGGHGRSPRSARPDPLDALASPRLASAPRAGAVGQRELRVELQQRHEHEPPRGHLAVGQRQPLGLELESPSSSRSTSSGRGPWRGPANMRPRSASIALQTSSSALGLELGSIRTAALRKSGWSRISPTGSVS